jgi:hypothetical protein
MKIDQEENDPHAQLLGDLRRARASLALRQRSLERSWAHHADPLTLDKLREEVNQLAALCMSIGEELWRATREEPPQK